MLTRIDDSLFHTMVENLPLAILLLDEDYKHIYSNSVFHTVSSLNTHEVEEDGWSAFLTRHQHKHMLEMLRDMSENQEIAVRKCREWTITRTIDAQHNPSFLINFTAQPQSLNLNGKAVNGKHVADSASPVKKQSAAELKKINSQLSTSNLLKDKILAIISHDMNAPIASLKGLTAAL
ncbi:MAG TPA: hypothetical protein VGN64_15485, partial [Dyadobacter sp.]|nr:hypothetical protein [Dyadobacter sp.]